jgi:hypothetical protein
LKWIPDKVLGKEMMDRMKPDEADLSELKLPGILKQAPAHSIIADLERRIEPSSKAKPALTIGKKLLQHILDSTDISVIISHL